MKEFADNGEPEEKESWIKDKITLVTTAVIIVSIKLFDGTFEETWSLYGFYFLLILLFLGIQHLLSKKKNQPFNFKGFFKEGGFYILAFLIGHYVFSLTTSISASVSDGIAAKFLSFLIGILYLSLVIFVFQIVIEKHSKI